MCYLPQYVGHDCHKVLSFIINHAMRHCGDTYQMLDSEGMIVCSSMSICHISHIAHYHTHHVHDGSLPPSTSVLAPQYHEPCTFTHSFAFVDCKCNTVTLFIISCTPYLLKHTQSLLLIHHFHHPPLNNYHQRRHK